MNIKLALCGVVALSLGACNASPPTTPLVVSGKVSVASVSSTVTTLCGLVPTADSLAKLITAFTGGGAAVATANVIAGAVCDAAAKVSTPSSVGLLGPAIHLPVVVRGVVVTFQ